jgi:hypothetical protein
MSKTPVLQRRNQKSFQSVEALEARYPAAKNLGASQLVNGKIYDATDDAWALRLNAINGAASIGTEVQAAIASGRFVDGSAFGIDPTGTVDSAPAINQALQAAAGGALVPVVLPAGTYLLGSTCFAPSGVFVVPAAGGYGSTPLTFRPAPGATFTGGWMFIFNSTDGVTAASNVYEHNYTGGLIGARLNNYNSNYPNIRGATCFGSGYFQDIRGYRLMSMLKRPANYYCDRWAMVRCSADQEYNGTTEYQLELDGTGDTVLIDRCTFPDSGGVISSGGTTPIKAVRFRNSSSLLSCASAVVRGSINGDHYFRGVKALTMSNYHNEFGVVTFDQTNFSFEDSYIAVPTAQSYKPVVLLGDNFNSATYFGKLKNVEYNYGYGSFISNYEFQIQTHSEYHLTVENCFKAVSLGGAAGALLGVRVCDGSGAPVASWNSWAHMASQYGVLNGLGLQDITRTVTIDSSYTGAYYIAASDSQTDWDESTGTYYYTTQYLIDPTNMVGVSQGSEQSTTISATTKRGIFLTTSCGNMPNAAVIRVYRGTSAGSYNKYADIPAAMMKNIQDTGTKVCGIAWQSRTAGAVDTLKSGSTNGTSGDWIVSTSGGVRRARRVYLARQDSNGPYGAYAGDSLTVYTTALTANRFTSAPSNAKAGDTARVVRSSGATGAFSVTVQGLESGGSGNKVLSAPGQWAEMYFDGTVWTLTGAGSL